MDGAAPSPKRSCLGPFAAWFAVKRSENLQGTPFCRSRSRSTEADKSLPLSWQRRRRRQQQQQHCSSRPCRECARTAAAPAHAPRTGAPEVQPHRRDPDTRAAPTCTDCTTPASCPRSSCCVPRSCRRGPPRSESGPSDAPFSRKPIRRKSQVVGPSPAKASDPSESPFPAPCPRRHPNAAALRPSP